MGALQAFHSHIFEGNSSLALNDSAADIKVTSTKNYLQQEKERLKKAIDLAKNYQLYKVFTEYENPLTFVE